MVRFQNEGGFPRGTIIHVKMRLAWPILQETIIKIHLASLLTNVTIQT